MRARHLIEKRRDQSGVTDVVGRRKPRKRCTGMRVDGHYREIPIARRAYHAVQCDRINADLISPPDQIAIVRNWEHLAREKHLAPLESFRQNDAGGFDIATRTQSAHERLPL
jgi:hypothetical protein